MHFEYFQKFLNIVTYLLLYGVLMSYLIRILQSKPNRKQHPAHSTTTKTATTPKLKYGKR